MSPEEKLEEIKKIIENVFEGVSLPISAWDKHYISFIDALEDIDHIARSEDDPLFQW